MTTNLVIPVGGLGKRFLEEGYSTIKPMIPVDGKPMLVASVESLSIAVTHKIFAIRKFKDYEMLCDAIIKSDPRALLYTFDKITEGPAITVYNALKHFDIDNTDAIYTANCDQIMRWDSVAFQHMSDISDGTVVTFEGGTTAHSFIELDKTGKAVRLTEKIKISNTALAGIHHWKRTIDFISTVDKMVSMNDRAPNGEFYIAPSYNYMIQDNKTIRVHHIPKSMFCPIGTPEELRLYLDGN